MQFGFIPGSEGGTLKCSRPIPLTILWFHCWLVVATCDKAVKLARNCFSEGLRVDPGSGGGSWERVQMGKNINLCNFERSVSFMVPSIYRTIEAGTVYLWGPLFHSKRAFHPCWCISLRSSPSSVSGRPFSRNQDPRMKSLDCLKTHGDVSA